MQLDFYKNNLNQLQTGGNFRFLRDIKQDGRYIWYKNRRLLNLSSNDYLGIGADKDLQDNFLARYKGKIQNPSARLLTGGNLVYFELEKLISDLLNKEAALLFNSGYHANVGIYSALLSKDDVVFVDKLNHASIIDGIKLSGAKLIPFSHLDYQDLEIKLKKYRADFKNSIISSESLFSMDGDFADINALCRLKNQYNSILVIDEAHSFGVYGNGAGYSAQTGALEDVDLIMGTFGKAIGSYGAFAAGKRVLIDYLVNFSRSFIFSTALPEISVSFSKFVIKNEILKGTRQKTLFEKVNHTKKYLKNVNGKSYIMAVVCGENQAAIALSDRLIKNGFYILPIRYPTVKKGSARVRISLNPLISSSEIIRLAECV